MSFHRRGAGRPGTHARGPTFCVRSNETTCVSFEVWLYQGGGTARAAAGRGTSPRSPRLDVARSLIIFISFALTSSLLHEITTVATVLFFSCGPPLSNSLRLTPPPCGHANWVDARASGGLAHCVERSITPALTGAEGRGPCWQACPVLNQARLPPLGARRARGRVRAVARPTASSAASFPHPLGGGRPGPLLVSMPGTQASRPPS